MNGLAVLRQLLREDIERLGAVPREVVDALPALLDVATEAQKYRDAKHPRSTEFRVEVSNGSRLDAALARLNESLSPEGTG